MKRKILHYFVVLMLFISFVDTYFSNPANATPEWPPTTSNPFPANQSTGISVPPSSFSITVNSSANFTIVGLGDMQHYYQERDAFIVWNITKWIVDQKEELNIVYVTQVGDVTDGPESQFQTAHDALENLWTTGIPYDIGVGNRHDHGGYGFTGGVYHNTYFGESHYLGRYYYGGHYGTNNDNHYTLFSASGMDFILISISFYHNTSIRQWADGLLQTYSDRQAIIVSHAITNGAGGWSTDNQAPEGEGTGVDIFNAFKDNANVFMMLCGHHKAYDRRTDIGDYGNTIYSMQLDYSAYTQEHYPPNGYIRLIQFCPATNQINVKTYCPELNTYLTTSTHQFTLDYDMSSYSSNKMNITWQTNASGEWITFNTSTNTTKGTYYAYNTSWVNSYNTTYYWRVLIEDENGGYTNKTYHFTTQNLSPEQRTADIPDSWLVLYNLNSEESITWKNWYIQQWNIPKANTLGLSTSTNERILLEEFESEIFEPVTDHLDNHPELAEKIMGILVGYQVPGNFYIDDTHPNLQGGGGWSVASNLQDLTSVNWWCRPNAQKFIYYQDGPQERLTKATLTDGRYLTARIDGPTLTDAKLLTERAKTIIAGSPTFPSTDMILYDYEDSHDGLPQNWSVLKYAAEQCPDLQTPPEKWPWQYYDSEAGTSANCAFQFSYYRLTGWNTIPWDGTPTGTRVLGYALNSWGSTTVRSMTAHNGRYVPNALWNGEFATALGATAEPYWGNEPDVSTLMWCLSEGWTTSEAVFYAIPQFNWMWNLLGDPFLHMPDWFSSETIDIPTTITNESTNINETAAIVHGHLEDDGNRTTSCGFWWDTTPDAPYTNNVSVGIVTQGAEFSYQLTDLTPGQIYFFKTWASNPAGINTTSNEKNFLTKPFWPTSFTTQVNNSATIHLAWTKGTGANNTYIEYSTSRSSWPRGSETMIYNSTGTSYSHTGLSENITYYYQAWSYSTWNGLTQWSDTNASAYNRTNALPVLSDSFPVNDSTDVSLTPPINITVNDYNSDFMTINWYSNSSGSWTSFGTNATVTNGTHRQNNINFSAYNTTYYWSVNCSDGYNWTNATYHFTTIRSIEVNSSPTLSSPNPNNETTDIPIAQTTLTISITDHDDDYINWTITTSPTIGTATGTLEQSGSKTCTISGLSYSTTYHWFVNTTDGNTWTNKSYWFNTESQLSGEDPPPSSPPPSSPPPETEPDDEESADEKPPNTPEKPSGPIFIERGTSYTYTSSAIDPDGSHVRLQFDWGDGTISNWTEFTDSNSSIYRTHMWQTISTFQIRVIAQDENYTNSSWSFPLNVTVSEENKGDIQPSVEIITSSYPTVNNATSFNSLLDIDLDNTIISYFWSFGDGETSTEKNPFHTYKNPGEYTVILTVTNNEGTTQTKSITITVNSDATTTEEETSPILLHLFLLIGISILIGIVTIVFIRKKKT